MSSESIKELLVTILEYNTVKITHTFSKNEIEIIQARCIPSTSTLELTFLQEQRVMLCECITEAVKIIEQQTNSIHST